MSTIVYQDLQSCSESNIIETTTLKLKVPTPTALHHPQSNITNEKCWSSLRNLSTNSKEKENSYVHPSSKRQPLSSRLSEQSLALCTENLGSETGTDQSSIFSFSSYESKTVQLPSLIPKTDTLIESPSSNYKVITYNTERCRNIPPPLTTLRGSNSLQFQPHREGGRLVIKAVESPRVHTYFQAERFNGRLRLCLVNDDGCSASKFDHLTEPTDEETGELEVENDIIESEINDEEEKDMEEREEEEESGMYMKGDMDGNSYDVEAEIGMVNCQRVRRCKEGRQGNHFMGDYFLNICLRNTSFSHFQKFCF